MSTKYAEQKRKETRAADILDRSASLARPHASPRVGVQTSQSFGASSASMLRKPAPPEAEKLSAMDPKEIANALMHASATVRAPILEQVNNSALNKLNITRQIVEALGKADDLQAYQSIEGAFASLSHINLSGMGSLPPWLKDGMVATFVAYFTTGEERYTPMVVADVQRLNMHLEVALKLLDWIDDTCQVGRVYRGLKAIQLLRVATPEIIVRIISKMHHFSPIAMADLSTGRTEPACLDTAIAVMEQFHETSFSVKVLEVINALLLDPPVYGTRNHAPTQRRRFVTALLSLLSLKFAARIRKFQETQEVSLVALFAWHFSYMNVDHSFILCMLIGPSCRTEH
jgi:hypothetical protein